MSPYCEGAVLQSSLWWITDTNATEWTVFDNGVEVSSNNDQSSSKPFPLCLRLLPFSLGQAMIALSSQILIFSIIELFGATILIAIVSGCAGIWIAFLIWGLRDSEVFEANTAIAALERKSFRLEQANERIQEQLEHL